MVSLGEGAAAQVKSQMAQLGTNVLNVSAGNPSLHWGAGGGATHLTMEEAEAIRKKCKNTVSAVSPTYRGSGKVKFGDKTYDTSVMGVMPEYETVENTSVMAGHFIRQDDVDGRTKVALLGMTVAQNLASDSPTQLIGQQISIERVAFQVIGILTPKGSGGMGQDQDDVVLIPLSTALRRMFNRTYVHRISLSCVSEPAMDLAIEQITNLLRNRHHLRPPFPDNDDFAVRSQTQFMEMRTSVTSTMTNLLGGIAFIALIVGGIGIMNIMLVSVTERTREIGIRKAVGAAQGHILLQFLIESLVIAVVGGGIGIALGVGGSRLLSWRMGWATLVNPSSVIMAVVVSAAVGLFFGIYPAWKASRLNPIEALRYE
jgi:putative ABC transport system permease protein